VCDSGKQERMALDTAVQLGSVEEEWSAKKERAGREMKRLVG
jgi:hypothetical protein